MKKKKKLKLNKYLFRRVLAILLLVAIVLLVRWLISNRKDEIPELSILLNNEFFETQKEVIIDEQKNIYFSKEDIQSIFDEMIYYNDAEKELITTYNTHTALLKVDESNMLVNDSNVELSGRLQEMNGIVYLPIKDLQNVYDIEIEYIPKNNRIIIDSILKEKKQATLSKNVKLKNKKGLLKKTVTELNSGANVIILENDEIYAKVRSSLGEIGYIKSNKLINETTVRESVTENIFKLKAYEKYSNISGIYEDIEVEKENLNVVIPTFFYLGKNSKILDKTTSTTATYANYTNWLKENSLELLPTLENTESVSNTLLTYSQRSQTINELCVKLLQYQYKGINVDFENIDDINSFYRFIIEMTPRFREVGLIVCVTINEDIDKERILKITDYILEE